MLRLLGPWDSDLSIRVFLVLEIIDTILDPCVALFVTVGWDHYSDLSYIPHLTGIGFLGE